MKRTCQLSFKTCLDCIKEQHMTTFNTKFFCLIILFKGFSWQEYWSGLPFPPPWKESYDQTRQRIKKQRHRFADKGPYGQSYGLFQ